MGEEIVTGNSRWETIALYTSPFVIHIFCHFVKSDTKLPAGNFCHPFSDFDSYMYVTKHLRVKKIRVFFSYSISTAVRLVCRKGGTVV